MTLSFRDSGPWKGESLVFGLIFGRIFASALRLIMRGCASLQRHAPISADKLPCKL